MCIYIYGIVFIVIFFYVLIMEWLFNNEDIDFFCDDMEFWVDLVLDVWLCKIFVFIEDLGWGWFWNLGFVFVFKLNVIWLFENEDLDLLELLEWRMEGVIDNLEDGDFIKVFCGVMFYFLILILFIVLFNCLKFLLECFSLYWYVI